MQTVLTTLALTALCWIVLLIIGQPVIRFFDLCREIREQMIYAANVAVPEESEADDRFEAARDALRRLGARMIALSETRIAAPVVTRCGYDPSAAGAGLIGLSNTLHSYGAERARWRAQVGQALKFPT